MPKLHELLAVRNSLKAQAAKTLGDLAATFEKRHHHFTAKVKAFTANTEGAESRTEEELELQTTVRKELGWLKPYLAANLDVHYQIALANQQASADIVLEGGVPLAAHVPASTLLELEDQIEDLRKFLALIPTLDPVKGFRPDPEKGPGVYVSREIEKQRTQMQKRALVLYPATDKHPAQTQLVDEQVPIGTIREREWSSMLTPAEKGDLLDRAERLSRAVKRARAQANEGEAAADKRIGDTLLSYVLGDLS